MEISIKRAQVHLVGCAIVVALVISTYLLGVWPVRITGDRLQEVLAETKQLEGLVDKLQENNTRIAVEINQRIQRVNAKYILPTDERPLLETLALILGKYELDLQNLSEEETGKGMNKFNLSLNGKYDSFMRFLHDIRRLDRPVRVASMSLSSSDSDGESCAAQLSLVFSPRTVLVGKVNAVVGTNDKET